MAYSPHWHRQLQYNSSGRRTIPKLPTIMANLHTGYIKTRSRSLLQEGIEHKSYLDISSVRQFKALSTICGSSSTKTTSLATCPSIKKPPMKAQYHHRPEHPRRWSWRGTVKWAFLPYATENDKCKGQWRAKLSAYGGLGTPETNK